MVRIRVEKWKKRRVIAARTDQGKFLSWAVKTKDLSLERASDIYKKNNTFSDSVKRQKLKNFAEYTVTLPLSHVIEREETIAHVRLLDVKIPKRRKRAKLAQWFVTLKLNYGEEVTARSRTYDDRDKDYEERARNEAWQNALRRLAQAAGLEYEPEEGEEVFESLVKDAHEGKVTYEPVYQKKTSGSVLAPVYHDVDTIAIG